MTTRAVMVSYRISFPLFRPGMGFKHAPVMRRQPHRETRCLFYSYTRKFDGERDIGWRLRLFKLTVRNVYLLAPRARKQRYSAENPQVKTDLGR